MRQRNEVRILGLTDVALGYGSPQIQQVLGSLMNAFAPASCLVVEPDQKGRPPRKPMIPGIEVQRIVTMLPPYDASFQIEFSRQALAIIRDYAPDVVVASHGWVLPAALQMEPRPKLLIYYMLESLGHQVSGIGDWAIELNRMALGMADLVLVPERRRAAADLRTYGWSLPSMLEVYNVAPWDPTPPAKSRKRRVLYAGTLGPQTLCERFLDESVADIGFDIAGAVDSEASSQFVADAVRHKNVRYLGFLSNNELAALRREYAYTISMWRPDNINQLYASPNKFFESIAAGVPPIAAPHPQCADIIARHRCGHIMMNWEMSSFAWTLHNAFQIFDAQDGRYQTMVDNCLEAAKTELNWEVQFASIRERLPSREALLSQDLLVSPMNASQSW